MYIRACEAALERGRGAIVLVPEIALTPQTLGRFRARFGDRVAVLHSALSDAERRDERERIASGEAPVVVGARSAVFAPVPSLGVVCVDEEHDASYKQESDPRYDARTVAAKRASLEGAVAVFGSATPRPESWQRLERLELGGRLAAPLPSVRVVDLRREAGYPLSAPLLAELGATRGERRQGDPAPQPPRRRAGGPLPRVRRDAPLPELRRRADAPRRRVLRCHHCGRSEAMGETCPACGSAELARIGAGTQKLERELAKHVPELELIRLDADVDGGAARRSSASRARNAPCSSARRWWRRATTSAASSSRPSSTRTPASAMPDFRAEERTFQLLTQLAGRSGRDAPGRVIVQTFQPDARAIVHAARHDVAGFLADELERRRALGYPPFRHLVRIVVTGPELDDAMRALEELKAGLGGDELLGPAPLLRLRGRHRAQLVGKTDQPRRLATRAAALLAAAAPAMRRAGLTAVVDVDPQSL